MKVLRIKHTTRRYRCDVPGCGALTNNLIAKRDDAERKPAHICDDCIDGLFKINHAPDDNHAVLAAVVYRKTDGDLGLEISQISDINAPDVLTDAGFGDLEYASSPGCIAREKEMETYLSSIRAERMLKESTDDGECPDAIVLPADVDIEKCGGSLDAGSFMPDVEPEFVPNEDVHSMSEYRRLDVMGLLDESSTPAKPVKKARKAKTE